MKKIFFVFICLFIVVSCGRKKDSKEKKPSSEKIVSVKEMTNIMIDVMLAEGAIGATEANLKKPEYYTWHYYNFILKKNNITIEQFRKSYVYYASDSDKMLKIMTNVVDTLSEKQSKIKNE